MPNRDYITHGLSTDPKPQGKMGHFFYETDTGHKYEWSGTQWLRIAEQGSTKSILGQTRHNVVNTFTFQDTATTTTVTADVNAGDTNIPVASTTGFAVGDRIRSDVTVPKIYPVITAIGVGPDITLDRPVDLGGPSGTEIRKILDNMNVAGTLAVPQKFVVFPPPDQIWNLTRLIVSMTHTSAGDPGLFGNLPALTNGVVLRVLRNGAYATLTNWKTSGDIKNDMYDVDFDTRSGGGGTFGTTGRGTFQRLNVTVELDGGASPIDQLEALVQDDLTGLITFELKLQGNWEPRL